MVNSILALNISQISNMDFSNPKMMAQAIVELDYNPIEMKKKMLRAKVLNQNMIHQEIDLMEYHILLSNESFGQSYIVDLCQSLLWYFNHMGFEATYTLGHQHKPVFQLRF